MLKIRLTRIGKTHQPFYRIVVAEARSKRDGQYTDIVGWYNPLKNEKKIDAEKYAYWVGVGAQPTESVERLVLSKEEKEKKWPSKPKAEKSKKE
ncbi:MAG: 30S ribosomal protein S16 [Candidatus Dojkabacteria bacterium]|nr:MAG: 30S ribosomal protein S16 [Candidatus Dojkabacteria bacterium]